MTHWMLLAQAQQQASPLLGFMPMVLIFLVFYFIWFMPIRKKQKALDELLKNLKKGDDVVTTGGFYGQVVKAEGDAVILRLAENLKVKIARRAIAGLQGSPADQGDR
jgi:preprotein translocase subunit YajC